ncbi:MAG TPA: hypothetical protein VIJ16_11390 [Gemmatimonadaceae bacterium]
MPIAAFARRTVPIAFVVSLFALIGCSGIAAPGDTGGTVVLNGLTLSGCGPSASPLPGWTNCTGTVTLNITKTVSSGYVSVYFNYPDDGSFYHGQYQVSSGKPGSIVVPMINNYVSACVTTLATTIDVYDGPESSQTAPLLASIATTIHATC